MSKSEKIVVGLDIGTTKTCAIVADVVDSQKVNIIGIGTHPSSGIRKGVIVNIESTVEAIRKAIDEAELMAGVQINSVYAGIAGSHIKGFNSRGVIAVKEHEVGAADIRRVISAAKAVAIPQDREILHILPQTFTVDDQDGIKDPMGMSGVRLEAEVHIITGAVTSSQNITKSIQRAGLDVSELILQPMASSESVLFDEEKELGVILVDIGGGTTDIAVFRNGSIWHTAVIPIGGNHITNDIAVGLRTPIAEAEKIKIRYGCALNRESGAEIPIEVPSVGGRTPRILSGQFMSDIVESRVTEIFNLVSQEIKKCGQKEMAASGLVITGGTAMMEGLSEIAEKVLDLPVRIGFPIDIGGVADVVRSPMYATGVGLILHSVRTREKPEQPVGQNGHLTGKLREWIKELF
ncbi:MAG: cell division protein FtsA [Nitrospirae bacterium]|nr:cell division protein FtsA [Nitrospirota bacterium]MBI3593844.1 cell division protein FtsA [Nitrospirota bacterium]